MKSRLSAVFARVAAPVMIAFALTANPVMAQGAPYDQDIQIDIPYDEYSKLSSEISASHITLINSKSTPQQVNIAIHTLVGMAMHRSQNVRSEALYSLKNIADNRFPEDRRRPATDALVLLAKTGRIETRNFLAENLMDLFENPRYAEFVLAFQADKDESVRYYFMLSQKRIAERDEKQDPNVLPYILDAADDPSARVREAAGDAMTVLARRTNGAYLAQALTFLETQMKDADGSVRHTARLNILRIGETHASVAPRALEVGRAIFNDPQTYGTTWMQNWPVDFVMNIARKQPAHRADAIALLEETARGTNAAYSILAAIRVVNLTSDKPAEYAITMRTLPLLAQSDNSLAHNVAANAARDIAINDSALSAQAVTLLGDIVAKSGSNAAYLATVAEKRPSTLAVATDMLDKIAASADESKRTGALDALAKIATLPGADTARLYVVFTRAFNSAKAQSATAAQTGLSNLAAREPALATQTTDTFAARIADPAQSVRGRAAIGLGQLASTPASADPRQLALISGMAADPAYTVRTDVVRALALAAQNPAFTHTAFSRMMAMASDSTSNVRSEILTALQKTTDPALLGHPAYIRALTLFRNDSDYSISNTAKTIYSARVFNDLNRLAPTRTRLETGLAATLANPGAAPAFVTDAVPLLGSIDPVTRMKGADMLGQIGFAHAAQAPDVVKALAPLAEDYEADIRFTVVRHVGMIGMKTPAAAEAALQALAPLARDADGRVSGMAVMAIGKIGMANPSLKDDAQAILKPIEQSSSGATQGAVRQQLRMLGP